MLNAQQLRHDPILAAEKFANHQRFPIIVVLDNIYDTFNIGSAFRVADAINAQKVVITGKNGVCPPDKQIRKSSIHICDYFPWEYHKDIENYLNNKNHILICEISKNSLPYRKVCKTTVEKWFNDFYDACKEGNESPLVYLIVGNETNGITESILNKGSLCHIPMHGIDHSMNVINALSIVGHELAYYFSGDYLI
jgi:23S rRNA (guanosine2251-2'-O)-methyltransferase